MKGSSRSSLSFRSSSCRYGRCSPPGWPCPAATVSPVPLDLLPGHVRRPRAAGATFRAASCVDGGREGVSTGPFSTCCPGCWVLPLFTSYGPSRRAVLEPRRGAQHCLRSGRVSAADGLCIESLNATSHAPTELPCGRCRRLQRARVRGRPTGPVCAACQSLNGGRGAARKAAPRASLGQECILRTGAQTRV